MYYRTKPRIAGPIGFVIVTVTTTWLMTSPVVYGSTNSANRHVREGIQQFRNGDYEGAAAAFADADVALPENETVAFDRACVYAAQGDTEKATELYQTAALSRDAALAASAHYNLGCVAAASAKALFGGQPEQALPDVRQEGLGHLARAVAHYRDCLRVDPNHAEARHNLELLRLWIKHMQEYWAQRDREKQREEMNLLEFLQMIQAEQQRLRAAARLLADESDSPKRRQSVTVAETAQRTLADEIDPLKQKIEETLKPDAAQQPTAAAGSAQPAVGVPDADKAIELLSKLADESHGSMLKAAGQLAGTMLDDAVRTQAEVLDALNEIYMAVAPFTDMLQKAIATQQPLVDTSTSLGAADQQERETEEPDAGTVTQPDVDFSELARSQSLIEKWNTVMPLKAEQELKTLEAAPSPPAAPSGTPGVASHDAQASQESHEAMKASLEKAIELCPKIEELAKGATADLDNRSAAGALPKQEESLKLLKEIAESLPKQPQEQQDQQQQDNEGDNQDQQQDPSQGSEEDQQQRQPQQEMSQQQAEAMLSKVREREQQHREMQKQLRGYLQGPVKVDKDW